MKADLEVAGLLVLAEVILEGVAHLQVGQTSVVHGNLVQRSGSHLV
jgi:hypothetical protein